MIKILRDLCLRNAGTPRAIDACCHLVSRVSDEEEVQKLIIKTFQELWFSPPEGQKELTPGEVYERCKQILAVTTEVSKPGAPRSRAEWLSELMKLMLADDRSDGRKVQEHQKVLRVGTQLAAQLIEMLLRLTEGENAQPDPAALGGVLHALSLFCTARPTVLLPHIELLPVYLQYEHCAAAIRHVCDMLPRLLPLMDHPPRTLLEKLEKYLAALIFRVPEPSMQGVIHALCSVCEVSRNRQLLGDTLARLCHWLRKRQASDTPTAKETGPQTKRALLCAGLLCRHFDFDAKGNETKALTCDGAHVLTGGTVNADVFSILLPFAAQGGSQVGGDLSFVQYSLKGLGHVCVRCPELAVQCKDVMSDALKSNAKPLLKQQGLANLLVLLLAEQEKSKVVKEQKAALKAAEKATGSARKMPTDGNVSVEATATAALSAVLQQHQAAVLKSLLDGRAANVRREGLSVVGAMLMQGLAHPAKCIPYVMALELDVGPDGCSDLAKKELRRQYDRYQSMVASPGAFLDGARAGYQLQRALATTADSQAQSAARPEAWPAFVYTMLNPKERNVYLKTLLNVLSPGATDSRDARETPAAFLERAGWTAQL